jgi:MFS transporter, DHA1 family, multidrug resistance protein
LTAAGLADLAILMTLIFLAFTWLGLVIPLTMVLALAKHGRIAVMASTLGGTLQMLTGAAVIVAVSLFFNGTALLWWQPIALCALAAFTLSRFTPRGGAMVAKPAK